MDLLDTSRSNPMSVLFVFLFPVITGFLDAGHRAGRSGLASSSSLLYKFPEIKTGSPPPGLIFKARWYTPGSAMYFVHAHRLALFKRKEEDYAGPPQHKRQGAYALPSALEVIQ